MQRLGSAKDPLKQIEIFSREICKIDPEKYDPIDLANIFRQWFERVDYRAEEAPFEFKIGKRTFKSHYIEVEGEKVQTLLLMPLAFLIEASEVKIEDGTLNNIDNLTALMYREDWTKDFSVEEYFSNAKFFNKQPTKYSLFGLKKFRELILTLKNTYPLLYQNHEADTDKEDSRKMFDMLNAIASDDPTKYTKARRVKIQDAFVWMENKKKEAIKRKHEELARPRR